MQATSRRFKTAVTAAVVIVSNVSGNFFLSLGMRRVGDVSAPAEYFLALLHPLVALGVCLMVLWMLSHMALLSWADLSFVLPITSVGYVLTAVAGRFLLNEHISPSRWLGIALIMTGVALVGRTPTRTTG